VILAAISFYIAIGILVSYIAFPATDKYVINKCNEYGLPGRLHNIGISEHLTAIIMWPLILALIIWVMFKIWDL